MIAYRKTTLIDSVKGDRDIILPPKYTVYKK